MAEEDVRSRLLNKEFLVLLPVVGSAIAISYDGYFHALDINLFTVFTISEHIAFALEIVPLAILATIALIIVPIIWHKGRGTGPAELAGVTSRAIEPRREITAGIKTKFYKTAFFWVQLAIFILTVANAYFNRSATSIAWVVIYTCGMILIEWFAMYLLFIPVVWLSASLLACLTLSFTIGMDIATSYRGSTRYDYLVRTADGELKANVVRSGERGLLFHDEASKQLLLLPWSEIKRVSSSRGRAKLPQ